MDRLKVSIHKCSDYDSKELDKAVDVCMKNIGGFEELISNSGRILLKPNLLSIAEPEKTVTTNPLFVEAVIRKILSALTETIPRQLRWQTVRFP